MAYAPVYPSHERIQQENRESRGCGRAAFHPLQFRENPQDAADHARGGRWPIRSRLELRRDCGAFRRKWTINPRRLRDFELNWRSSRRKRSAFVIWLQAPKLHLSIDERQWPNWKIRGDRFMRSRSKWRAVKIQTETLPVIPSDVLQLGTAFQSCRWKPFFTWIRAASAPEGNPPTARAGRCNTQPRPLWPRQRRSTPAPAGPTPACRCSKPKARRGETWRNAPAGSPTPPRAAPATTPDPARRGSQSPERRSALPRSAGSCAREQLASVAVAR